MDYYEYNYDKIFDIHIKQIETNTNSNDIYMMNIKRYTHIQKLCNAYLSKRINPIIFYIFNISHPAKRTSAYVEDFHLWSRQKKKSFLLQLCLLESWTVSNTKLLISSVLTPHKYIYSNYMIKKTS